VRFGLWAGGAIAVLAPLSGWLALVLRERWRRLRGGWIALGLFLFRRPHYESLIAERRAIRDAIARLAGELGTTAAATAGATTG
jgi:hypothetical protein